MGEIPLPGNEIIKHTIDPQNDPGKYKMEIVRELFFHLNVSFAVITDIPQGSHPDNDN